MIRQVLDDEFHLQKQYIIDSLDNFILEFGMFSWEIGESNDKKHYLTISPNGNPELLPVSRHVVKNAPLLKYWHFYYAKPVKDWDLTFRIYDENMDEREVNAAEWKFSLEKSSAGKVSVVIYAGNADSLDTETLMRALEIVVTAQIGEESRIKHVEEIILGDERNKSGGVFGVDVMLRAIEDLAVKS